MRLGIPLVVSLIFFLLLKGSGDGELRGSRLEAWMKSHKSEVAIT